MATAFERVMDDRKKIVEELMERIKSGYVLTPEQWNKYWIRPQNPTSMVYYKGVNRLKLGFAAVVNDYKDPRWITFKQAQDRGWKVKKGSKGILCEKWIFSKIVENYNEKTGQKEKVEIKLDKPIVNYFIVYNAQQIEGMPDLYLPELPKSEISEVADDLIKSSECPIREVAQEKAYYSPMNDEIVLPMREVFKDENAFCSVVAHEMIHSTGHPTRLNRPITSVFGSLDYAKEEVVAELGAVFLLSNLGIKIEKDNLQQHSNYLKSWLDVLSKDYNELFRAAKQSETAANRIYENYLQYQRSELYKLKEDIEKSETLKKEPFADLKIKIQYNEHKNIPENTVLEGISAYEYLKELMKVDKEIARKNKIESTYYYDKVKLDFFYKDFSRKDMRIDLGDLEFKNALKVSSGMENRLKLFIEELKDPRVQAAIMREEKMTSEEYDKTLKSMSKDLRDMIKDFKVEEKEYLKHLEQQNGVKSSWSKKIEKEKSEEIER